MRSVAIPASRSRCALASVSARSAEATCSSNRTLSNSPGGIVRGDPSTWGAVPALALMIALWSLMTLASPSLFRGVTLLNAKNEVVAWLGDDVARVTGDDDRRLRQRCELSTDDARIVVDEDRRVVVGATITGAEVAESLHAATIAVIGEVPLDDLRFRARFSVPGR